MSVDLELQAVGIELRAIADDVGTLFLLSVEQSRLQAARLEEKLREVAAKVDRCGKIVHEVRLNVGSLGDDLRKASAELHDAIEGDAITQEVRLHES